MKVSELLNLLIEASRQELNDRINVLKKEHEDRKKSPAYSAVSRGRSTYELYLHDMMREINDIEDIQQHAPKDSPNNNQEILIKLLIGGLLRTIYGTQNGWENQPYQGKAVSEIVEEIKDLDNIPNPDQGRTFFRPEKIYLITIGERAITHFSENLNEFCGDLFRSREKDLLRDFFKSESPLSSPLVFPHLAKHAVLFDKLRDFCLAHPNDLNSDIEIQVETASDIPLEDPSPVKNQEPTPSEVISMQQASTPPDLTPLGNSEKQSLSSLIPKNTIALSTNFGSGLLNSKEMQYKNHALTKALKLFNQAQQQPDDKILEEAFKQLLEVVCKKRSVFREGKKVSSNTESAKKLIEFLAGDCCIELRGRLKITTPLKASNIKKVVENHISILTSSIQGKVRFFKDQISSMEDKEKTLSPEPGPRDL